MDSKVEPIFSSHPLYMDLVMDYVKKLSHNKDKSQKLLTALMKEKLSEGKECKEFIKVNHN